MIQQDMTIQGKHVVVTYLDKLWFPTDEHAEGDHRATMTRVRYDDGRVVYFNLTALPKDSA